MGCVAGYESRLRGGAAARMQQTLVEQLIEQLELERHIEGGYFRRTYESSWYIGSEGVDPSVDICDGVQRLSMSTIFYMLTAEHSVGCWHRNRSDIVHCYQLGAPLTYWVLSPAGVLERYSLGPNVQQGDLLQLVVPGGSWKATQLERGDFGLISEAVTPGFRYEDREMGRAEVIRPLLSASQWEHLKKFLR